MNRRQFLLRAAVTSAALAVPELWVPNRTIFLPPRGGWPPELPSWIMANEAWNGASVALEDWNDRILQNWNDRMLRMIATGCRLPVRCLTGQGDVSPSDAAALERYYGQFRRQA